MSEKLRNQIVEVLVTKTVEVLVTILLLGVGGFVFFRHIAPPPDLSGSWKFTVKYEDTAYSDFEGLLVTYQVLLVQEGLDVSGSGEKLSDRGPTQADRNYEGKHRAGIDIVGNITHNYFSPDTVVIHYKEAGEERQSSTVHRLAQLGEKIMSGRFWTTIASTSGPVWWQRSDSSISYDPVGPPSAK